MPIAIDHSFRPKETEEKSRFFGSFEEAFRKILSNSFNYETGESYVANYLKELDAKSSVTFHHSVKVAAHVYDIMMNGPMKGNFTRQEILTYTTAALLHDVGKLSTRNEVLHSTDNLAVPGKEKEMEHMMRHSIDGYEDAKRLGFGKTDIFFSLGHHIAYSSIQSGAEGGFENAGLSKKQWMDTYEEGYIEGLLMQECSWITEKDKEALGMVSFCDVTEAIMSTERAYQKSETNNERRDWNIDKVANEGTPNANRIPSACTIVKGNASEKVPFYLKNEGIQMQALPSVCGEIVEDKAFQKRFDLVQSLPLERMVRNYVAEYAKDYEVTLSADKVKDIKENSSLGAAFLTREETEKGTRFVLDRPELDEKMVFYPKREEPDFSRGEEDVTSLMEESKKEEFGDAETPFFAEIDGEDVMEEIGQELG